MRNLLLAISAALLFTLRPPSAADSALFPAPDPAENAPQTAPTLSQPPTPRWVATAMAIMVAVLTGERQRLAGGMVAVWQASSSGPLAASFPPSGLDARQTPTNLTAPAATLHHCGPPSCFSLA